MPAKVTFAKIRDFLAEVSYNFGLVMVWHPKLHTKRAVRRDAEEELKRINR